MRVIVDMSGFEAALERAVYDGLDAAASATAREAAAQHVYQNRTGNLERSTAATQADGDVWSDSASASAYLGEPYGTFVDRWARARTGSGIVEYAWQRAESGAVAAFERILIEALTRV